MIGSCGKKTFLTVEIFFKGHNMISDDIIGKLITSIQRNTSEWTVDNDLLIHKSRIFIGNFNNPSCLIIHIAGIKYGVTSNTINAKQAKMLSETIMEIYNNTVDSYVNSIVDQL